MYRIIALLIGYAFGMIQTSYIVGRFSGIDIREHGSKSAGFTNTNRVLGIKKGAIVFFADIAKAIVAFLLATWLLPGTQDCVVPGIYAGLGTVLGHAFPFYLKFKGGKSVASLLGIIIMLDWRVMAISFAIMAIIIITTRFISLGSLLLSLSVPILLLIFNYSIETIGIAIVISILIWVLHRDNIKRLLSGTENKFSFKRKQQVNPTSYS